MSNASGNSQVILYQSIPNPASESVIISYLVNIAFNDGSLNLTTSDGKLLKQFRISQSGHGSISLDTNNLADGIYPYSLIIDGKVWDTKSIIITKE
jgi:hypothetical protein